MLLQHETEIDTSHTDLAPVQAYVTSDAAVESAPFVSGGRYGEGRKLNPTSVALTIGAHLLLVPVLLSFGAQALQQKAPHIVAVNLAPAPPKQEQQPEPAQNPEPRKLDTEVTPQPEQIVPAPAPAHVLLASSAPAPAPVTIADAPPAPILAPRPAAAGPSVGEADLDGIQMISGKPPRYPKESRRKKEQGTVRLRVLLGTDGRVETISVSSSSGFPRLDKAALDAVRRWRWAPVMRNGEPIKVLGYTEIPFVLSGA